MSSRAVRQFARTVLATLTSPYFDTINVEQNPTDNVWVTAEFAALGSVKETYCEAWVEEGDIVLTFFGRPGIGDDALLQQAEADAARFYAGVDPAGKVVLVNKSAPEDFYITEEGPRFGVIFRFGYEFRA